MDDSASILADAVTRLLENHADEWDGHTASDWAGAAWSAITEMGLPLALVDEAGGGFGLSPPDALAVIRIAGSFALPLPLAEMMLGAWIVDRAGLALPNGILTVAPTSGTMALTTVNGATKLQGNCRRVPFARNADWIVIPVLDNMAVTPVLVARESISLTHGENLAGEVRDDIAANIEITAAQVGTPGFIDADRWRALGATIRCQSIAGAGERVLAMTLQYARDRKQFGKPLSAFQAIQHNLAIVAGQVVAMRGAADMAAEAFATGDVLSIAAAKARCSEAVGVVSALAHQIHGAIGFTQEYALHRFTKRLWAWREEYGSDIEWQTLLGRAAIAQGADGLWPLLTRIS